MEIYVPSDSDEEFDPKELVNIAKPPPSNFVWPPPIDEPKVPIAAPLYTAPPETQHITAKPCTYRPLETKNRLVVHNIRVRVAESPSQTEEEAASNSIECLNVESNNTFTTTSTTSNASSESEYKVYQTLNNFDANSIENSREDDEEVEEINETTPKKTKVKIDFTKTPPPIQLPKIVKTVEFVEPDADYEPETFKGVFSNRKEAWMKMTSSVDTSKVSASQTEQQKFYAEIDDNPENSEEEVKQEIVEQIEETQAAEQQEFEEIFELQTQQEEQQITVEQLPEDEEDDEEEDEIQPEIQGKLAGVHEGTYYQLPPSNIPQPIPRGYQSDFQKALVYTSDRPYNIHDVAPTPTPKIPYTDLYQEALTNIENQPNEPEEDEEDEKKPKEIPKFYIRTTKEKCEFPYGGDQIRIGDSMFSSMMRTASPKPYEFMKSNVIEEIHLPNESEAYFPPPICMTPHEPYGNIEDYRSKSPFVKALVTIPDRPFTPFGREIKSQVAMEMDVNKNHITFSNALHMIPDDSYDPSEEFAENVEYEAKSFERIAVDAEAKDAEPRSPFVYYEEPTVSTFLPKLQPWSRANEEQTSTNNSLTDTQSGESMECHVSQSRRCSEMQTCSRRKSSAVLEVSSCERRESEPRTKKLADLLSPPRKIVEEVCEPEKPTGAMYPKRLSAPSPFEGMQMKVTNKNTSKLHKADEIPVYQRKWFNLPTQNPPQTPEPEELRENIPVAFKEWSGQHSRSTSRRNSFSATEPKPEIKRDDPTRASVPAIPIATAASAKLIESEMRFPVSKQSVQPASVDEEGEDEVGEMHFPTQKPGTPEGHFPTAGKRKNSVLELDKIQKVQFQRQKDLKTELERQQQRMMQKQKVRQQVELDNMQKNHQKFDIEAPVTVEPQQNSRVSNFEREQEFKRQVELERQQRVKEQELREKRAREMEYQRQQEELKQHEIKMKEKRERDLQFEAMREMEYQKHREQQEEIQRRQQEARDAELRRQQEEMEIEIRKEQEKEKREAEAREAKRLYEERMKEERDRELAKIEAQLREKREAELKQLEQEIKEKREQRRREAIEAEARRKAEIKAREEAEREQIRLEQEAALELQLREKKLREELRMRQKQEADRKQREEMELFNIEKEKRRQEKAPKFDATVLSQQIVWPASNAPTPAPVSQAPTPRPIPIIKTDSETELNSTKFHFQPLDEDQRRCMAAIRPPSTCYSPPTTERPFPSIPYYQQHLTFYEAEPQQCGLFDPKKPFAHNRSRSPAFGPPPNPLMAFVNKERDPVLDESGIYLCGERLLSPVWYDREHKACPPGVQRKIHIGGSTASRPPSKPDLSALTEAIKKHKRDSVSKAAPTPPPMPSKPLVQPRIKVVEKDETTGIPKGIVAKQLRRLSGDASSMLLASSRSSSQYPNDNNCCRTTEQPTRTTTTMTFENRQQSFETRRESNFN